MSRRIVQRDGDKHVVRRNARVEKLEGAVLCCFDCGDVARQVGELPAQLRIWLSEYPPVVAPVLSAADDRQALKQLCRYITRPALANERVQTNTAGQVVLKFKTPWRDGTTHLVMSPLEFMQRLAALVPRPRLHLIRFHGMLAPNAKLRALVVPQVPQAPAQAAKPAECAIHPHLRLGKGW